MNRTKKPKQPRLLPAPKRGSTVETQQQTDSKTPLFEGGDDEVAV